MSFAETTLWCRRDAQGRIVALTRERLDPVQAREQGWEAASVDDPEVAGFLHGNDGATTHLSLTDAGMGRVTEDLIDVLIDRGVIQFTDLPQAAQSRLMARRSSREAMANRLDLVPSEDDPDENVL